MIQKVTSLNLGNKIIMKKRITILATTKRRNGGVCIAGIDSTGSWVRPVKDNGNYFVKDDLFFQNRVIIDYLYELDFELDQHIPEPPNTEDYKISEEKKPQFIRQIMEDNERLEFLTKHSETSIESIFGEGKRSMGLVECSKINEMCMGWDANNKFYSTISFVDPVGVEYDLSSTDLRWAAFGKSLMKKRDDQSLYYTGDSIKNIVPYDKLYFALGLTRESDIKLKELIIGVVTIPDYAECKSIWEI